MSDLFDTAPSRAYSVTAAARELVPAVLGEEKITRAMLNEAMTSAFGGSDADGRWTQRESFEVLEHAIALAMRNRSAMRSRLAFEDVMQASALLARLPTQTVRSEEQIEWQQFSTPLDLSTVAVLLASSCADDIVLEPSAGNGLLVAQLGRVTARVRVSSAPKRSRIFSAGTLIVRPQAQTIRISERSAAHSLSVS